MSGKFTKDVLYTTYITTATATGLIILSILTGHAFLWKRFSGIPYISNIYNRRIRHLNKLSIFLFVTRALEMVNLILVERNYGDNTNNNNNNNNKPS